MIAGDNRLFVVTDSSILSFSNTSDGGNQDVVSPRPNAATLGSLPKRTAVGDHIAKVDPAFSDYGLVLRVGNSTLAEELCSRTNLQIISVDPDSKAVESLRQRMRALGKYGSRVAAINSDLAEVTLPPYFASTVTGQIPKSAIGAPLVKLVRTVFNSLRPYGGFACWELTQQQHDTLAGLVAAQELANARLSREGSVSTLERVGSLPGSRDWTHQYADATNSVVSRDSLVKTPLGLLWFGGPPNDKVLPRHGHGPSPQVAGGRLVIEGADMLRCVDVYTGRVLWEKDLPGLGTYCDTTKHFPGAGEIGSNYVTLPDAVYVAYIDKLLHLDAATGETIREVALKAEEGIAKPTWGCIGVEGDLLIATTSPVAIEDKEPQHNLNRVSDLLSPMRYASSSKQIVAMDRHTGKVRWKRTAEFSFRHNAIALASHRVFCIDSLSDTQFQSLNRRGITSPERPRLFALDALTGEVAWSTNKEVFGTFLNYSRDHDILLQAGSAYRDRAKDEAKSGMVAYRGTDGSIIWQDRKRNYGGPCLLWRDKIITNGGGGFELDLLTGKTTGWGYKRMYGCNTAVGSEHLLTFRSGAAGFCDLAGDSGTGNIGGFRSSCTANLIAANGVLNAPDYTRTCVCAYQNQCSLALIHMPEVEQWTFSNLDKPPEEFAINFGAPDDRRDADGMMWYDEPRVGGASPDLQVTVTGKTLRSIRHHSSRVETQEGAFDWVASSAVVGCDSVEQALSSKASRTYAVRLTFAELEDKAVGERVFDVAIQGETLLKNFDIMASTQATRTGMVKEFRGVSIDLNLKIDFRPIHGEATLAGLQIIPE